MAVQFFCSEVMFSVISGVTSVDGTVIILALVLLLKVTNVFVQMTK
jgi:hypothetical protein